VNELESRWQVVALSAVVGMLVLRSHGAVKRNSTGWKPAGHALRPHVVKTPRLFVFVTQLDAFFVPVPPQVDE
jgi:hypothetical protein